MLRPLADRVAICPPLIITEAEIDELFDKLTVSLDQAADQLTRDGVRVA